MPGSRKGIYGSSLWARRADQAGERREGLRCPSYSGALELRAASGGIAVINELPVETYLCGVVPSEMPASYELEALKAQAVCARSYAFRQMTSYGYPEYEAHVNDSTDFQVYNNSERQESSTRAVTETEGQVVRYKGEIATTYYYSTSCGRTTSLEAWGTDPGEGGGYLQSVNVCGDNGIMRRICPGTDGRPRYRSRPCPLLSAQIQG